MKTALALLSGLCEADLAALLAELEDNSSRLLWVSGRAVSWTFEVEFVEELLGCTNASTRVVAPVVDAEVFEAAKSGGVAEALCEPWFVAKAKELLGAKLFSAGLNKLLAVVLAVVLG